MLRVVVLAASLMLIPALASGASFYVPATANIYLGGQTAETVIYDTLHNTADSIPAQAAFEVVGFSLTSGSIIRFSANGLASNAPLGDPYYYAVGPEGRTDLLVTRNTVTGETTHSTSGDLVHGRFGPVPLPFSGVTLTPLVALLGVFTSDVVPPVGGTELPPPSLDFGPSGYGRNFTSLAPGLRQVFFIGDGRTDGGILQDFIVPVGATRLFIGISDGPGTYANNYGGFDVQVQVVPEPLSVTAISAGLLCLLGLRRRLGA